MDLGVISVRYARALLKSAMEQKLDEQVYREMQTLSASYLQVPDLRFTIDNPMLSKDKKQLLLETACGQHPSAYRTFLTDSVRSSLPQFLPSNVLPVCFPLPCGREFQAGTRSP